MSTVGGGSLFKENVVYDDEPPGFSYQAGDHPMTEKNTGGQKLAGDSSRAAKKPYFKPEFRYERAFETMALACGKVRATQGLCRFNRKNS